MTTERWNEGIFTLSASDYLNLRDDAAGQPRPGSQERR
jgi:hypothetical protein